MGLCTCTHNSRVVSVPGVALGKDTLHLCRSRRPRVVGVARHLTLAGLHRAASGLEATLVEPMLARVFPRIGAVQRVLERYQCGSVGNR